MSANDDELISWVDVGTRIHLMRRVLGFSQTEIARALDQSVSGWNQWELGKRQFPVTVAAQFWDRYSIPLEWIYLGDKRLLPYEFGKKIDELSGNGHPEKVNRHKRA